MGYMRWDEREVVKLWALFPATTHCCCCLWCCCRGWSFVTCTGCHLSLRIGPSRWLSHSPDQEIQPWSWSKTSNFKKRTSFLPYSEHFLGQPLAMLILSNFWWQHKGIMPWQTWRWWPPATRSLYSTSTSSHQALSIEWMRQNEYEVHHTNKSQTFHLDWLKTLWDTGNCPRSCLLSCTPVTVNQSQGHMGKCQNVDVNSIYFHTNFEQETQMLKSSILTIQDFFTVISLT